jgi:hypothetical protein
VIDPNTWLAWASWYAQLASGHELDALAGAVEVRRELNADGDEESDDEFRARLIRDGHL